MLFPYSISLERKRNNNFFKIFVAKTQIFKTDFLEGFKNFREHSANIEVNTKQEKLQAA